MPSRKYSQLLPESTHMRALPASRKDKVGEQAREPKAVPPTEDKDKKRSWQATVASQIFCLLWIAPIMTLLVFNLNGFIIGPSAWCPSGQCYPQLFGVDMAYTQDLLKKYNEETHNLLGALQLASKALEVWFEIIASAIIYLVTIEIASKREGLSIGYIMIPFEFSRVPIVFDFILYRIAPSLFGARSASAEAYRRRIYFLLTLAFCLCGVCNLMGPATAVLILPTLQWIDTTPIGNSSFVKINAGDAPHASNWFMQTAGCDETQAVAHNYSCSLSTFGVTLDSWLGSSMSYFAPGMTQQDFLSFGLNSTYEASSNHLQTAEIKNTVYWAPNRQTVSGLDYDYSAFGGISQGYSESELPVSGITTQLYNTYAEYNKSLDIFLLRNGPILGAIANFWSPHDDLTYWTVDVDGGKQLRCYGGYQLGLLDGTDVDLANNYTKCITVGSAWSPVNKAANFSIAGAYDYDTGNLQPSVFFQIYSSNRAFFLPNGTVPSWMPPACLANGSIPSDTACDWDRLTFESDLIPLANRSSTNVNTIEMTTTNINTNNQTTFLATDFVAHSTFSIYSLDASPLSNPFATIQSQNITAVINTSNVALDPAWVLAAWSADAGGTLLPDRTATRTVTKLLQSLSLNSGSTSLDNTTYAQLLYLTVLPAAQTLSLIDYTTTSSSFSPKDPLFLYRNARMHVYAYKISSRTAILGTVIAIIGIVVVLCEFVLAITVRRPFRSSTQILISALAHAPTGEEFVGKEGDEVREGKVRFRVSETEGEDGKLRFRGT